MRFLEDLFEMGDGYVLDFTNATFAEFFEDERVTGHECESLELASRGARTALGAPTLVNDRNLLRNLLTLCQFRSQEQVSVRCFDVAIDQRRRLLGRQNGGKVDRDQRLAGPSLAAGDGESHSW